MPLFIANGTDVQLTAGEWRRVSQGMLRHRRADLAFWNSLIASVKGEPDDRVIRITLSADRIEDVRRAMEQTA